jgi:hypothetical protein
MKSSLEVANATNLNKQDSQQGGTLKSLFGNKSTAGQANKNQSIKQFSNISSIPEQNTKENKPVY